MPEGDSLNWKIRGKGSRRVLSLVRTARRRLETEPKAA